MKRIDRFSCEYCGGTFDTPDEAIACELRHALPMIIKKNHFVYQFNPPRYIDIQMFDGSIDRYEFYKSLVGKATSAEEHITTKVDKYSPDSMKLIEYTIRNAREMDDSTWADLLGDAYARDHTTLDDAIIEVLRAWAAKHNL